MVLLVQFGSLAQPNEKHFFFIYDYLCWDIRRIKNASDAIQLLKYVNKLAIGMYFKNAQKQKQKKRAKNALSMKADAVNMGERNVT